MDIDPNILNWYEGVYDRRPWGFEPGVVDVLEISLYKDSSPRVLQLKLNPEEFVEWVDRKSWSSSLQRRQQDTSMIGELRLIFTKPVTDSTDTEKAQDGFPMDDAAISRADLPFSKPTFNYTHDRFRLPRVPDSSSTHVGSYIVPCPIPYGETTLEGTKMLLLCPGHNREHIGAVISMSHLKEAGITNVMLFHISEGQSLFLRDLASSMAILASHPAMIPVLVSKLWLCGFLDRVAVYADDLLNIEADGGLTGFSMWDKGELVATKDSCDDPMLSVNAVKLNQYIIHMWYNLEESLAMILIMKDFITSYMSSTEVNDSFGSKLLFKQNLILSEELSILHAKTETSRRFLTQIRERTELQIAGINNQLAFKNNEINLSLARSSQRIAQETRKDSSAMKSIAVLTMVFLPATFIATLFEIGRASCRERVSR